MSVEISMEKLMECMINAHRFFNDKKNKGFKKISFCVVKDNISEYDSLVIKR